MKLNDSLWGLDFIFRHEESGFKYDFEVGQENNFGEAVQTFVMFELSTELINCVRQVDTIFDILASLGGLFNALSLMCFSIISLFHFYGSYQFIMDDLFTDAKNP